MSAVMFIQQFVASVVTGTSPRTRDERGASFTEYVVLLALIVGIIVLVLGTGLSDALDGAIDGVVDAINGA